MHMNTHVQWKTAYRKTPQRTASGVNEPSVTRRCDWRCRYSSRGSRRRLSLVSQKDHVTRRACGFELPADIDEYGPPASCYDTRYDRATYARPPPPAPPSAAAWTYDYTAGTQVCILTLSVITDQVQRSAGCVCIRSITVERNDLCLLVHLTLSGSKFEYQN